MGRGGAEQGPTWKATRLGEGLRVLMDGRWLATGEDDRTVAVGRGGAERGHTA